MSASERVTTFFFLSLPLFRPCAYTKPLFRLSLCRVLCPVSGPSCTAFVHGDTYKCARLRLISADKKENLRGIGFTCQHGGITPEIWGHVTLCGQSNKGKRGERRTEFGTRSITRPLCRLLTNYERQPLGERERKGKSGFLPQSPLLCGLGTPCASFIARASRPRAERCGQAMNSEPPQDIPLSFFIPQVASAHNEI